ncbi:MAG: hypothetical protein KDB79_03505, partial [Acidobacteria bacterium]|nr:hypothetical protein [Acidobacteriota bacterium]
MGKTKSILSLLILLTVNTLAFGQTSAKTNYPGRIGGSEYYNFYSHFWFNMHHFFQQEALTLEVSNKSVISTEILNKLTKTDREKLERTIAYYRTNLVDKDLRADDYMSDFKVWIITQNENEFSSIPDKFKEHISHLLEVKKIYKDNFWGIQNA